MGSDYRLQVNFFEHPKTIRLFNLRDPEGKCYGSDGIVALLSLWAYACKYRPDGIFRDLTREDVARICRTFVDHSNNGMNFLDDLIRLAWVDTLENGSLALHDWSEHQPWIASSSERKRLARQNANIRWKAKNDKSSNTLYQKDKHEKFSSTHASGNAPFLSSPIPKDKDFLSERLAFGLAEELWEKVRMNNQKAKPPKLENWAKEIGRMLRLDKRTVEDVQAVIAWSQQDSFWSTVILSAESLRRNHDTVLARMYRQSQLSTDQADDET